MTLTYAILNIEIVLTHSGPFYPVALPQTHFRFVPDNIVGPGLDLCTVGKSAPDSVTLPLLCENILDNNICQPE